MRLLSIAALAVAVLLTPARTDADLIFTISGGEVSGDWGPAGFQISDDLNFGFDQIGSADFASGQLLAKSIDEINGVTGYSFGPGTLNLTLSWWDDEGNPVDGTFVGATEGFSFEVCEGCDTLFGGGTADISIQLGKGLFDGPIANALGIHRKTLGGEIFLALEDIDGDAFSDFRSGFDYRGFADLRVGTVEVPEPGLLMLGLVAGAAWFTKRRRSTQI